MKTRFVVARCASALLTCIAFADVAVAQAQTYPARPIRLIVPFGPGSGTDIVARTLAPKLSASLGQQVVVDNRAGAGGIMGTRIVATAAPDGYTILFALSSHAINATLYKKLPYDSFNDFAPVTQLISTALVLVVSPQVPANTVKELISYVKSRPGKLSYASGGIGSPPHLAGELFKSSAELDVVHVPFAGAGPAITETMANRTAFYFAGTASAKPFVPDRLKALAVTSKNRSSAYPDTPTMIEAGVPEVVVDQWYAILAPRNTPRTAVATLQSEFAKSLQLPDVKERLNGLGVEPVGSTPEQFGAYLKSELVKYEKIVRASGASVD
jgi:tripartite-type tricarboxylate transporter receptor subunit TctC